MSRRTRRRVGGLVVAWALTRFWGPVISRAQECFAPGRTVPTTEGGGDDAPFSVVACDLNSDGVTDLATANDATDTISVLLHDGGRSFGSLRRWPAGEADTRYEPVDIACCDLNGDGRFDLITANHSSDNISILYNAGNQENVPQFLPAMHHPVGQAPWAVRCSRVDPDPRPDIVTANLTSDTVSVLINDGDGGIDAATSYWVEVGDAPKSIALCDIDGDTDLDVVTANVSGRSVTVLRNDGLGRLVDTGDVPLGVNPFGVTCCDVDGVDGADVVTANIFDDSVMVLLNDAKGSFGDPVRTGDADGSASVACGDVDRDGAMDVVSANLSSNDIAVFWNEAGRLDKPTSIAVGTNPSSVIFAALTAERAADLAIAFADGVFVLANTCRATGDLDGDGDSDLADVAVLQRCFGVSLPDPICQAADADANARIDLDDYRIIAEFFSGPARTP